MRRAKVMDGNLQRAVHEMRRGLIDADLGGGVVKKRLAVEGRGKRGGVRTLVATRRADRWFFLFGFEKSERANVRADELRALQALAQELLAYDDHALDVAVAQGELVEVSIGES